MIISMNVYRYELICIYQWMTMKNDVLSCSAWEIIPNLWISSKDIIYCVSFLKQAKINVIFNCTESLPFLSEVEKKKHKIVNTYYRVPIHDDNSTVQMDKMYQVLPKTVSHLIEEYQRGSRILLYCKTGQQQSMTILFAFLLTLTYPTWINDVRTDISKVLGYEPWMENSSFMTTHILRQLHDYFILHFKEKWFPFLQSKYPYFTWENCLFQSVLISYMIDLCIP